MENFPAFMRNPKNRIAAASQHTADIEGWVFDGADGSQMAFWQCVADRDSEEHAHEFEEYFVVVHGQYTLRMGGRSFVMGEGDEIFIPKGTPHSGSCVAGTRTIHAFGGKRAERTGS